MNMAWGGLSYIFTKHECCSRYYNVPGCMCVGLGGQKAHKHFRQASLERITHIKNKSWIKIINQFWSFLIFHWKICTEKSELDVLVRVDFEDDYVYIFRESWHAIKYGYIHICLWTYLWVVHWAPPDHYRCGNFLPIVLHSCGAKLKLQRCQKRLTGKLMLTSESTKCTVRMKACDEMGIVARGKSFLVCSCKIQLWHQLSKKASSSVWLNM